ncbi:hypothetical protein N1851_027806 [Merluccius polli]|uniref:Uncharacterized protein n=1 Tax=Merluccius polli TaxID=89951 RepID=A0AA47NU52_MERPO|nr:hypothetical protein N1851_027806 [Merluccius polli]
MADYLTKGAAGNATSTSKIVGEPADEPLNLSSECVFLTPVEAQRVNLQPASALLHPIHHKRFVGQSVGDGGGMPVMKMLIKSSSKWRPRGQVLCQWSEPDKRWRLRDVSSLFLHEDNDSGFSLSSPGVGEQAEARVLGGGVNIICCDFIGLSQFCSLIIDLNYKLTTGSD